jgi:hypothetical protein
VSSAEQRDLDFMAPAIVNVWQRRALIVGCLFAIPSIIGWVVDYDQFYRSYLVGFLFCLELTVGSLALLMLYHLTGGAWGTVIRRVLEAAMQNIWLLALLFVPIAVGVHQLYPWSRPGEIASNDHLQRVMHQYLRLGLWLPRAVLYFITFAALVSTLMFFSRRQDREPKVHLAPTLSAISGPGAVIYLFVTLFLYTDWVMSLTPEWFSMIYGLIFNAGHGLASVSFAVVIVALLVRYKPMQAVVAPEQFVDLGKIMLTFVMVWAWWTYAQWIIFWSGNKPDQISWYLARTRGGWQYYGFAEILVAFCIPFALLLSRGLKSNPSALLKVALLTLFARYMDIYWFVTPAFPNRLGHFHYSWLDAVVPISLLGFWLALFFRFLKARPLLALTDPHVDLVLEQAYGNEQ